MKSIVDGGGQYKFKVTTDNGVVVESNTKVNPQLNKKTGEVSVYNNNVKITLPEDKKVSLYYAGDKAQIHGDGATIKTPSNKASDITIYGNKNELIDGSELNGPKPDKVKIIGDENTYTAAFKGTPATSTYNGDKIYVEGNENTVKLKSGNTTTIDGESNNNTVIASESSQVNDYSDNKGFLKMSNNTVKIKDGNPDAPVGVKAGSDAFVNVKVEDGAAELERPNRDKSGWNDGAYKVTVNGKTSDVFRGEFSNANDTKIIKSE